jgi:hypothetical protein
MKKWAIILVPAAVVFVFIFVVSRTHRRPPTPAKPRAYLGFNHNDYPGDDQLSALKKTFSYAGCWLDSPPNDRL